MDATNMPVKGSSCLYQGPFTIVRVDLLKDETKADLPLRKKSATAQNLVTAPLRYKIYLHSSEDSRHDRWVDFPDDDLQIIPLPSTSKTNVHSGARLAHHHILPNQNRNKRKRNDDDNATGPSSVAMAPSGSSKSTHAQKLQLKRISVVHFGWHKIDCWYDSPYPIDELVALRESSESRKASIFVEHSEDEDESEGDDELSARSSSESIGSEDKNPPALPAKAKRKRPQTDKTKPRKQQQLPDEDSESQYSNKSVKIKARRSGLARSKTRLPRTTAGKANPDTPEPTEGDGDSSTEHIIHDLIPVNVGPSRVYESVDFIRDSEPPPDVEDDVNVVPTMPAESSQSFLPHRRLTSREDEDKMEFVPDSQSSNEISEAPAPLGQKQASSIAPRPDEPVVPVSKSGSTRLRPKQQPRAPPAEAPTRSTRPSRPAAVGSKSRGGQVKGRATQLAKVAAKKRNDHESLSHVHTQQVLYVCDGCMMYTIYEKDFGLHKSKCTATHPPGRKVYECGSQRIWEVDGSRETAYCRRLTLFGKLFINEKYVFHNVEDFVFYIVTDGLPGRDYVHGFFSKEKRSFEGYNLACIIILPPFQSQSWAALLIEMSYELSSRSNRLEAGTPERPLSDLGLAGYTHFWVGLIIRHLVEIFKGQGVELNVIRAIDPDGSDDSKRNRRKKKPQEIEKAPQPIVERPIVEREEDIVVLNDVAMADSPSTDLPNSLDLLAEAGELSSVLSNVQTPVPTGYEDQLGPKLPISTQSSPATVPEPDFPAKAEWQKNMTIPGIAHACAIRPEDAAHALQACGLAERLRVDDAEFWHVIITPERVKRVAELWKVKRKILDPACLWITSQSSGDM